jgi:hypothetical protein
MKKDLKFYRNISEKMNPFLLLSEREHLLAIFHNRIKKKMTILNFGDREIYAAILFFETKIGVKLFCFSLL